MHAALAIVTRALEVAGKLGRAFVRVVLEMEFRVSCVLSKCCTAELYPKPFFCFYFETRSR